MQIGFTDAEFLQIAAKLERCDELEHENKRLKEMESLLDQRLNELAEERKKLSDINLTLQLDKQRLAKRNLFLEKLNEDRKDSQTLAVNARDRALDDLKDANRKITQINETLTENINCLAKSRRKVDQLNSVVIQKNEEIDRNEKEEHKLLLRLKTVNEENIKLTEELRLCREESAARGRILESVFPIVGENEGVDTDPVEYAKNLEAIKASITPAVDPAGPKGDVTVRCTLTGTGEMAANPFDFGIARSPTSLGDGER